MTIKELERYVNDNMLDNIFNEREDSISELSNFDINKISEINKKYPANYENIIDYINSSIEISQDKKDKLLIMLDEYIMKENLLHTNESEKFYKIGFCDGIRIILENLKE